jgi:hypothetical protein
MGTRKALSQESDRFIAELRVIRQSFFKMFADCAFLVLLSAVMQALLDVYCLACRDRRVACLMTAVQRRQ